MWSDAGGEFNSAVMRDLCESLGIAAGAGPGYTPTSNTLVERHHAVVDRIFEKMVEESPSLNPQVALGWAIHSHNTYPGQYGYSPFQLTYGRNPRLPGVYTDQLPALSGSTSESVAKHLKNIQKSQEEFRSAVNLKNIKVALAQTI